MRCPPCTSRESRPARPLTLVLGPFPAPPPQAAPEDMRSPACCLQTPRPSHPVLQAHPPPHSSETSSHAVHPLRGKTLTVPVMPGHHQSAPGVISGRPQGQLQQTNPDSHPRRTVRVLGTPRPCPESRMSGRPWGGARTGGGLPPTACRPGQRGNVRTGFPPSAQRTGPSPSHTFQVPVSGLGGQLGGRQGLLAQGAVLEGRTPQGLRDWKKVWLLGHHACPGGMPGCSQRRAAPKPSTVPPAEGVTRALTHCLQAGC